MILDRNLPACYLLPKAAPVPWAQINHSQPPTAVITSVPISFLIISECHQ
jgi:hypothetical protein